MKKRRAVVEPRRRGPRVGEGGRPEGSRRPIYEDEDRFVLATLLWLRLDPKEQRFTGLLQMLDNLLTPHEGVELMFGEPREIEGVKHHVLSIHNVTPDRAADNNWRNRKPLAAPGGTAFRRSRLQNLRAKFERYRGAEFSKQENAWMGLCRLGLDFVAHGMPDKGFVVLDTVGWQLPEAARQRIIDLLRLCA